MKVGIFETYWGDGKAKLETLFGRLKREQIVSISTAANAESTATDSSTYHWVTVVWEEEE